VVGEQPGQLASEDRLVDEQRGVAGGLEPDVALDRRHPQDARQLPQLDLLHRPGRGVAEGVQGAAQPTLGGLEPPAGRPGRPAGAGRPHGQLVEDLGQHGLVVPPERRAGEVLAPGPPGTRAWRCRLAGRGHERGRQHPGGLVLVLARSRAGPRRSRRARAEPGGWRRHRRSTPWPGTRSPAGPARLPAPPPAPPGGAGAPPPSRPGCASRHRSWAGHGTGVRPGRAGGRGGAGAGR
jgi:hypothetical protein